MNAWYNEFDPKTASWLGLLSLCGEIEPGPVDDRDVKEVTPTDVEPYAQCHFFAGIGGWSYALRLAGWPVSQPVWTASLPCQPFSAAGQGRGHEDERHLWPVFHDLLAQCLPPVLVGEQVASKAGRAWLAAVFADLEDLGYACAGADLCAAGVGAPHIRQRLYWVAYHPGERLERRGEQREARKKDVEPGRNGADGGVGNPGHRGRAAQGERSKQQPETPEFQIGRGTGAWNDVVYVPCADGKARPVKPGIEPLVDGLPGRVGLLRGYGNSIVPQVAAVFLQSVMDSLP